MLPDDICEVYSERHVDLTVRVMPDEPMMLIEGKPIALRMLAQLLLAMADEESGDSFFIAPNGPGKMHFSREATHGIYIHVL